MCFIYFRINRNTELLIFMVTLQYCNSVSEYYILGYKLHCYLDKLYCSCMKKKLVNFVLTPLDNKKPTTHQATVSGNLNYFKIPK